MKVLFYYLNIGPNSELLEKSIFTLRRIGKYDGDIKVLSTHYKSSMSIDINEYICDTFCTLDINRNQMFQMKYIIDNFINPNDYDLIVYSDTDVIHKDTINILFDYIAKNNDYDLYAQENVFGSFMSHVDATDFYGIAKTSYMDIIQQFQGTKHICAGFFVVKPPAYDLFINMRQMFQDTKNLIDDQTALNLLYKTKYLRSLVFPRELVYMNNASAAPIQHCVDKSGMHRFFKIE